MTHGIPKKWEDANHLLSHRPDGRPMATPPAAAASAPEARTQARRPAAHPQCPVLPPAGGLPLAAPAQGLRPLADGLSLLAAVGWRRPLGSDPRIAPPRRAGRRWQTHSTHRGHPRQPDRPLGRSRGRQGLRRGQENRGPQAPHPGGHPGAAAVGLGHSGRRDRSGRAPARCWRRRGAGGVGCAPSLSMAARPARTSPAGSPPIARPAR